MTREYVPAEDSASVTSSVVDTDVTAQALQQQQVGSVMPAPQPSLSRQATEAGGDSSSDFFVADGSAGVLSATSSLNMMVSPEHEAAIMAMFAAGGSSSFSSTSGAGGAIMNSHSQVSARRSLEVVPEAAAEQQAFDASEGGAPLVHGSLDAPLSDTESSAPSSGSASARSSAGGHGVAASAGAGASVSQSAGGAASSQQFKLHEAVAAHRRSMRSAPGGMPTSGNSSGSNSR